MSDAVTLAFIAERLERVLEEMAQMRDDMRVMAAMIQRIDGTVHGLSLTVQGLTNEVRAEHARFDRIDRRVRALENKP